MTKSEQVQKILDGQDSFYNWKPPGTAKTFRCWHIQPYNLMTEEKCRARARKPEIFKKDAHGPGGCSDRCPRWRYYSADDGIERLAYR